MNLWAYKVDWLHQKCVNDTKNRLVYPKVKTTRLLKIEPYVIKYSVFLSYL